MDVWGRIWEENEGIVYEKWCDIAFGWEEIEN